MTVPLCPLTHRVALRSSTGVCGTAGGRLAKTLETFVTGPYRTPTHTSDVRPVTAALDKTAGGPSRARAGQGDIRSSTNTQTGCWFRPLTGWHPAE